jgi:hypothetical protein
MVTRVSSVLFMMYGHTCDSSARQSIPKPPAAAGASCVFLNGSKVTHLLPAAPGFQTRCHLVLPTPLGPGCCGSSVSKTKQRPAIGVAGQQRAMAAPGFQTRCSAGLADSDRPELPGGSGVPKTNSVQRSESPDSNARWLRRVSRPGATWSSRLRSAQATNGSGVLKTNSAQRSESPESG